MDELEISSGDNRANGKVRGEEQLRTSVSTPGVKEWKSCRKRRKASQGEEEGALHFVIFFSWEIL